MAYASSVVPAGWRECNGSSLDGSTAAFADLFTAIGKRFGAGNGSASGFNVPDLRGKFIRGWSHGSGWDPDAGSRTNSFGGNTGDNVGSYQGDGYASHNHPFSASGTTGTESQYHSHKTFSLSWGWRTLSEVSLSGGGPYDNIVYGLSISSTPGGYTSSGENVTHTHSINLTNQATNYTGGSETRPKNVYLMYIIKL
jgi:microcystin-dependent protein